MLDKGSQVAPFEDLIVEWVSIKDKSLACFSQPIPDSISPYAHKAV